MASRGRDRVSGTHGSRSSERGQSGREKIQSGRDRGQSGREKSQPDRGGVPPSRHLWVGNISHNINQHTLCQHFSRFGEIDSVGFQLGRSYAFVNFKDEETASLAMRKLQDFVLGGLPLKIEFAKEKPFNPSPEEGGLRGREEEGSPYLQRDTWGNRGSPDGFYHEKFRGGDRGSEPSEILWIGFPSSMTVDEPLLSHAFSPFGEIVKIATFPGRSYAFVQFRSIAAASHAKETLHGKLFGNPRVHICFSRSEYGPSTGGRGGGKGSLLGPHSPHYLSDTHPRSPDGFWHPRNTAGFPEYSGSRSPPFRAMDPGPPPHTPAYYDQIYPNQRSEVGLLDGPRFGEDSVRPFHHEFPQMQHRADNAWDPLPDEGYLLPENKKQRMGFFPAEKELPDYQFLDSDLRQPPIPNRMPEFISRHDTYERKQEFFNTDHRHAPPPPSADPFDQRNSSSWRGVTDDYPLPPARPPFPLHLPPRDPPFLPPKPQHQLSLDGEWKWEGTIAKGGNPVCHARCFPVGRPLDFMLPDFLDCTARTGIDMLGKHYYQATSSWVVFFVPQNDADIALYNEFLHYLEDKQRAAVSKLDEKTTLFLVAPSEFSEKVLKVPGRLSISGVILRLERPAPPPPPPPSSSSPSHRRLLLPDSHQLPIPPPPFSSTPSTAVTPPPPPFYPSPYPPFRTDTPDSFSNRVGHTSWDPSHTTLNGDLGSAPYTEAPRIALKPPVTEIPPPSFPLQSEQVSQLVSSILHQQQQQQHQQQHQQQQQQQQQQHQQQHQQHQQQHQQQRLNFGENQGHMTRTAGVVENQLPPSRVGGYQYNDQGAPAAESASDQLGHVRAEMTQQEQEGPRPIQGNQSVSVQEKQGETDAETQKRLQATLQLAAALLQQIQQGKST